MDTDFDQDWRLFTASAVHYDPHCDVCYIDNIDVKPDSFCLDCVEFLCKSCQKVHSRLTVTKKHKVLRGNDMPSSNEEGNRLKQIVNFEDSEKETKFIPPERRKSSCQCGVNQFDKLTNRSPLELCCLSQISATALSPINAKSESDFSNCCNISKIAVMPAGSVLLLDAFNSSVKFFSPDCTMLSILRFGVESLGSICVVDSTTAIVGVNSPSRYASDSSWKLHILNLSDSGSSMSKKATIVLKLRSKDMILDMALCGNSICFTSCGPHDKTAKVTMTSMSATELWTVEKAKDGRKLFKMPEYLTAVTRGDRPKVFISDTGVEIITSLDGTHGEVVNVCKLTGMGPAGITSDQFGHVYISYSKERKIAIWSEDLSESHIIISNIQAAPGAIAWISDSSQLLVSYKHRMRLRKNENIDRFQVFVAVRDRCSIL